MKNVKTVSATALALILAFGLPPRLSSEVLPLWPVPLTASVEMGRFDPEPNCRKDVDGCFPKHWVSTTQFQPGTPVWMKVTIANRSELAVVRGGGANSAWIPSLVDASGKTPELTKEGCWDRDPACPCPDDRLLFITAAPPNYWEIMPGSSAPVFIEVSRDFVLQPHGEYVLLPEIAGFYLTSKAFTQASPANFTGYDFDYKQAKKIPEFRMKPIRFTVLP